MQLEGVLGVIENRPSAAILKITTSTFLDLPQVKTRGPGDSRGITSP